MKEWGGLFLIAGVFFLSGCGGDGNSGFPRTDLEGVWTGTLDSAASGGFQSVTFNLIQEEADSSAPDAASNVTGRFSCAPGSLSCLHSTGIVSGTLVKQHFGGGVLFPNGHSCGLNGTVSGSELVGDYTCSRAAGGDFGSWKVTKVSPAP